MNDTSMVAKPALKASGAFYVETVKWVQHWTPQLFSFRTTRDPGLRFTSGQFVMVGLMTEEGRPLVRAYSIASPAWHDELEFYSIKVPDGPLTSRLQKIQVGDQVLIGRKPTGTLVMDGLKPGKRLYMLGAGTGLAPWLSLARDPETYERFDEVIVTRRRQADALRRPPGAGRPQADPAGPRLPGRLDRQPRRLRAGKGLRRDLSESSTPRDEGAPRPAARLLLVGGGGAGRLESSVNAERALREGWLSTNVQSQVGPMPVQN